MTPLMYAASTAADETISSLLSLGASPDVDAPGSTALMSAIQSKCVTTINLLAPVTQGNLGGALVFLARDKIDLITEELRQLVQRAAQDKEAAIKGLEAAAQFGSSMMIDMIAQSAEDHSIFEENTQRIWMQAVKSDCGATVSALLQILPNPPLEAIPLARERGMPGVVSLLMPDTKMEGEKEREALREVVSANTAQLLDRLPRDVEFDYNRKIVKLKPLLDTTFVPYAKLLKHLHLPKPHFGGMLPMCSLFCCQKQICRRVRETLDLVHLIVGEVGERIKVFEGIEVSMIGSTREGSRAFDCDEVDVHLSLKKNFNQFSFFDVDQNVLRRDQPSEYRLTIYRYAIIVSF